MVRRRKVMGAAAAAAMLVLAGSACGRSAGSPAAGNVSATRGLVTTTPPGRAAVSSVTWAVYRDVNSLDPIYAFDYPENTAVSLMCESLLRQAPDGSLHPGLATLVYRSPTQLVFTLRPGVRFWDGHPVTPADVVYSLERNTNTKLGGFYGLVFKSFKPGVGVTAVADTHYWNPSVKPRVKQILLKGAPDISSFTSAMLTGGIQGSYSAGGIPTLSQLQHSGSVRVYQGPGWSTDAFIVSSFSGALGDVRVRRALSLALDRKGIIDSVYKGAALMPRWLSNPGTFGYGKSVFSAAYARSPVVSQNIAEGKKLVQAAGATGKTITIGTSSQLADISADAGAYQAAAQAIGLKAVLKSVSAQNYINFFIDPKARQGIDGFLTANYGDYADPAAMLATLDLPGGSQNYDNFNDPQIVAALEQARSTANPNQRAALVVRAEQLTMQQLPWIPDVQPTQLLMLSSKLSGAVASFAYMFAPWANSLGGTG
jgi:peptide/nickel transport system substrate-binding protein